MKESKEFAEDLETASPRLMFVSALKRSAGGLVEYPLECIKTRWQANPHFKTLRKLLFIAIEIMGYVVFMMGLSPVYRNDCPFSSFDGR